MRSTSFEIRKMLERNQGSPRASGLFVVTDSCDDYLACRICDRLLRLFAATHFKVYRERECVELLRDAQSKKVESDRFKIGLLRGLMTATAQSSNPAEIPS